MAEGQEIKVKIKFYWNCSSLHNNDAICLKNKEKFIN